ncbi:hypothetical protein Ferp_1468 [Ferroglobus placidus DSM 10642]|uniref:Uncharacterized protein n=1 Tax=Ferroglobus placidus (strain DSM 10642 / AEDII12DO) TaxID=589924 RepID=D3RYQ6_FERPA|nr:hypothetical protein [Ferroglobus placidus]ADC65619.1 hypothetical protein Ferp_1468 [Ferroglobus placidus DSM 10642]
MPEKMRVVLCGYDPMLVRGYVKAKNEEALWFYLPKELYEDYKLKPGDKVKGVVEKIYAGKTGEIVAEPNEEFVWETSRFTGMAVVVDHDFIAKYKLTAWHFLELTVNAIIQDGEEKEVYPGETKQRKFWPDERLKLHYTLDYVE